MRKLSTKKLQLVHNIITDYDNKNKDIVFDIPSMMKYCIENDVRKLLEEKRLRTNEINGVLKVMIKNSYDLQQNLSRFLGNYSLPDRWKENN